jgi:hypothetical protein
MLWPVATCLTTSSSGLGKGRRLPTETVAQQKDYSSVFGKLILSKFDSMPEWVRVCTFLVSLAVLVYVTCHSLNSRYFVSGTVLEPSPIHDGSNQLARGYDVRWADNYAGTNSKGYYVFVLTPTEYFSLVATGNHTLEIWKPGNKDDAADQQVCSKSIQFQRVEGSFDDYYINGQCQSPGQSQVQSQARQSVSEPSLLGWARGFTLVPAVYAAQSRSAGGVYRLLVKTMRFDASWPRRNSAEMIFFQDGVELPLLNASGEPYGSISVLPGGHFAFAEGTYITTRSLQGGRIRLADRSGLFGYTEEWFDLPARIEMHKRIDIRGSMGSNLSLLPVDRGKEPVR